MPASDSWRGFAVGGGSEGNSACFSALASRRSRGKPCVLARFSAGIFVRQNLATREQGRSLKPK
ncbi:MAG: hypothetical protein A2Z72_01450 [Omnitrophica bacterium RBG_13_46_9]|nr:MAG: hypothetical protein A2Z72_01450 [Omnitrophica bacterium RBG_13_46_9]